jgi:hypothetical protein
MIADHIIRVGASDQLGGLLYVYCDACDDDETETTCRHLAEFDRGGDDPTPAELLAIERRHLDEIARAEAPHVAAGSVVESTLPAREQQS